MALLEGGDERAEAELIGAEIVALLAAGCAPGEIAIVTRGAASIAPIVAAVLDARGIPHSAARRERFADTALGGGLLALVRAALLGGSAADLVRWLRVPGLVESTALVDRFEALLLTGGIDDLGAARALWEAEHWPLDALERLGEASGRSGTALLDRVERELEALFAAPWRREAALLDRWQAAVLAAARRTLRELRELARADASLAGGAAAIVAALEGATVEQAAAGDADAVLICDALALRARRVRALFISGLQEGVFPAATHEAAFLSSAERAELAQASGLLLAPPPAAERYLFYALCSRPTRWLRVSWHDATDDGDAAVRSLFVDDLVDCFGDELLEARAVRGAGVVGWSDGELPAAPTLARLEAALRAPRARAPVIAPLRDPELLERLRGRESLSPSALEKWLVMPRRLARRARPARSAPRAGRRAARASARSPTRSCARSSRLCASAPAARASIRRACRLALELLDVALAAEDRPLSPNRAVDRAEGRRLLSDLRRYLTFAARSPSTHEPRELELAFGLEDTVLPAVSLGEAHLEVSGRIDRVDLDPATGTALVYDYKASRPTPAARWADDGRLQQALYMLAVEQLLGVEAVGGLYQPYRVGELRPRGAIREDVDPQARALRHRSHDGRGAARSAPRPARVRRRGGRGDARCRAPAAPRDMLARRALPLPGDLPQRGAMSVAFTTEQQDALERRSGPLALSANAGSGKTSVLVERYVRAVLRGRHRARADPRDHLHRPCRGRAARARARAPDGRRRARGRAREPGRGVRLDLPRLLRAAAAHPRRARRALARLRACSARRRRRRCATAPSTRRSRAGSPMRRRSSWLRRSASASCAP